MRIAVQAIHGVEPCEVSVLQFLTYARQSGGLEPLINIANGHQERKFIGGSMTISEKVVFDDLLALFLFFFSSFLSLRKIAKM